MDEAGEFDCVIDMVTFTPEQAVSAVEIFRGRTGQFIFCSTVDVYYRTPDRYPIREDFDRRPSSLYGENKVKCEDIVMAAHARGDFAATIIRPAQTYGEGGRLVHSMGFDTTYLDRIRRGKPIVVHGDGSSLWVTCHVDDVGPAFVAAIGNSAAYGRAYHVTGEQWMTWNDYHRGVAHAMDAPPPTLVHIPTDLLAAVAPERAGICKGNLQYHNIFDNAAARADLAFRPSIPWVEGVRRTIAWLDAEGRINNSDDDPLEDRIIAAWQRMGAAMIAEFQPDSVAGA
jgi:nucleoside-diphosphate-sugar epimerase